MAGLNGDESASARRGDFVVRDQLTFDDGAIISRFDHARAQVDRLIGWRRTFESNRVIGCDSARWMIDSGFLHQVISRGPIAMTIEQRADDAATQHPRKRFLISRGMESSDNFITFGKAANVQPFFIRWSTAKASHVRRVSFLKTFFHSFRVQAS